MIDTVALVNWKENYVFIKYGDNLIIILPFFSLRFLSLTWRKQVKIKAEENWIRLSTILYLATYDGLHPSHLTQLWSKRYTQQSKVCSINPIFVHRINFAICFQAEFSYKIEDT